MITGMVLQCRYALTVRDTVGHNRSIVLNVASSEL